MGADRAIAGSSQALGMIPGLIGEYLRRAFLAHALAGCAPTVVVGFGTQFSKAGAQLDDNVYVGPGGFLGLVHIERDVLVASGVHIPSGASTHRIDDLTTVIREQARGEQLVRIGAGCWIGEGAVVMADVGQHSVIGGGAVVTRAIPAWSIAAGVPARVIRRRGEPRAAMVV